MNCTYRPGFRPPLGFALDYSLTVYIHLSDSTVATMDKDRRASQLKLAFGLTAGVVVPMGQIPLNLWPLSLMGFALLFCLLQYQGKWSNLRTVSGFSVAYLLSGQLWTFCSLYLDGSQPTSDVYKGLLGLFVTPAATCAVILSLYPACRRYLRIDWFTPSSCVLFSAMWGLFELFHVLLPNNYPMLLSGYAILGRFGDFIVPITGILGSSFLMVLLSSLLATTVYTLATKRFRHLYWTLASVFLLILGMGAIPEIQWTRPYDNRAFDYSMVINQNADNPDNFPIEPEESPPKLVILGGVEASRPRPCLWRDIVWLNKQQRTAVLVLMPSPESCPQLICSLGEGEGCSPNSLWEQHPPSFPPECRFSRFPLKRSLLPRHPAVDSNRLLILSQGDDGLPFPAINTISGAEIIVVFDIPYKGQVIRERLLRANQARALETGRPLLRYSNLGVSAEIDHMGIIRRRFLPEQNRVYGSLTPMTGNTPFMYLKGYTFLALIILIFVFFGYRRFFQKT